MGSLAAALPEMSKMPESPPGFYGFDPLNLKDRANRNGVVEHGETGLRKGGGSVPGGH